MSDKKTRNTHGEASGTVPVDRGPGECEDPLLLTDEDAWLVWMEPALCRNPNAAELLAHLLYTIKTAIESDAEGAARAVYTLSYGIRLAYEYTEAHKASLKLFNLYLSDQLRPEDEPLTLISSAIARAKPRSRKRRRSAQNSSKRSRR